MIPAIAARLAIVGALCLTLSAAHATRAADASGVRETKPAQAWEQELAQWARSFHRPYSSGG